MGERERKAADWTSESISIKKKKMKDLSVDSRRQGLCGLTHFCVASTMTGP
jgi:hypothetical protein